MKGVIFNITGNPHFSGCHCLLDIKTTWGTLSLNPKPNKMSDHDKTFLKTGFKKIFYVKYKTRLLQNPRLCRTSQIIQDTMK